MTNNFKERVNFIWSIADLLRGDYKQSEYGRVILPLAVPRRLDCVLEPTKKTVLDYLPQAKGLSPEADGKLRDAENAPLTDNIEEYFKREVLPRVPDAWMDQSKDKVGYEINFTKEFYKYKPLRSLEEIRRDILNLEKETEGLMDEVLGG